MKLLLAILLVTCSCEGMVQEQNPSQCVVDIATAQLQAMAQKTALCGGDSGCVAEEVRQRALITAGYVQDLCYPPVTP